MDNKELKNALEEASENINEEGIELNNLKEEEKKTIDDWKKFTKKEILKTPSYYEVEKVIERVINGYGNGCLIISEGGLGKTTIAKTILKEKKVNYVVLNTFTTPLSFYKFLFHNKKKTILLDDVIGLWTDMKAVAMLKSALELDEKRLICYESESAKVENVPRAFNFEGRIILLTNKIDLKNSHIEAVEDRIYTVELNLSLKEKIMVLEQIKKKDYNKLTETQRDECFGLIKKYATEKTKLTIRTLVKIYNIYASCDNKKEFEKQALFEMGVNKEIIILKEIADLEVKDRDRLWEEKTGKSVRTLRRKLADNRT